MAGYTDATYRPHRDVVPACQDHLRDTRSLNLDGARRAGRAQQGTIPCRNSAEHDDQEGERDSEETCHCCKEASCGGDVQSQYQPRIHTRGGQLKSVRLGVVQRRLKTKLPLVPPKPNELESAVPIFILRAVFGT